LKVSVACHKLHIPHERQSEIETVVGRMFEFQREVKGPASKQGRRNQFSKPARKQFEAINNSVLVCGSIFELQIKRFRELRNDKVRRYDCIRFP
jgi:hypothetical protein